LFSRTSFATILVFLTIYSYGLHRRKVTPFGNLQTTYYRPLADFHGDTGKYVLDNFYYHPGDYKNKEVSRLLNKLNLPVKCFIPILEPFDGTPMKCVGMYLSVFDKPRIDQKVKKHEEPGVLMIWFKKHLPESETMDLTRKAFREDGGVITDRFTESMKDYYGPQLIDSILYVQYFNKKIINKSY